MEGYKDYRKKNVQPMRPYVPGEDMSGVSVSAEDTPEEGGRRRLEMPGLR